MNYVKNLMFGTLLCLVAVGFSDTANGQITTNAPAGGMSFQVQSGGATQTQTLTVTTTNGSTTLVVIVPNAGSPWLTVNGNPAGSIIYPNTAGGVPASVGLQVAVNTTGLIQGQQVMAGLSIAILNEPSTAITVPIVLTVGTPSLLSASPATLNFSAVQGAQFGSPSEQAVTISSSGPALNYSVSAFTTNGGNWIGLSASSGLSTNSSVAGFQVSVDAQSLPAGTYNGTVVVQATTSGYTGNSVTIPVTVVVGTGAALNVSGTLNNFIYQAGSGAAGFSAQTQNLAISASGGSLNWQVTAENPTGPVPTTNWLLLNPPIGGTTPQNLSLSLSYQYVANLPVGTYTITLAIAPTAGAGTPNDVTVTLVVSNNGILSVNNNSLTFNVPFGSPTTQSQVIQVTSSNGASIPYTVQSSASWLTSSPTTGNTITNPVMSVFVNDTGLAVSSTPYVGTLTLTPNNSDFGNYTVTITVQLTVSGTTNTLFAGPAALLFSYQTTQSPPSAQQVYLSSATTLGFNLTATTMTASNCPNANWLSATANQAVTPATLTVNIQTAGMTSGFCTGTIIVTYNNGQSANSTVNIPVTVDVGSNSLLTITPVTTNFGVVTAAYQSSTTLNSQISINSTDGTPLGFSAFASTPGAPVTWLYLGSTTGTTQQYLQVEVQAGQLPVGTYTGSITITPTDSKTLPGSTFSIPVTLIVSSNTTVSVSPLSLTFTQGQGASTGPASQTITMTAAGGSATFIATVAPVTGGSWLQITPSSGSLSGTITASVPANTLSVGKYTSNINLQFLNSSTSSLTIPVTLSVTPSQAITVSPTSLTFNYQLGSGTPATQTLNVTSTQASVPVTATTNVGWLVINPPSASTPATAGQALPLVVSIVPPSLTTVQTYTGTITITPASGSPITVNVSAVVTGVPAPQPVTISNSASGAFGSIAPGELITIKGTSLGPPPTNFTVSSGTVSSSLAGVQVTFDGIPGTPIYVSPTQINAIVPYEIAGRASTNVVVSYSGQQSAAIPQTVASQAPGIFTASSSGSGQASVLNQNGTLNGPSAGLVINGQSISTAPAPEGSIIAVYMTGGGQTSPASTTGTVTPSGVGTALYNVPGKVTATINNVPATVEFAGAAPGLVTGVIQVNILVPTGITGSALPIAITIGGSTNLAGPTVAIQ